MGSSLRKVEPSRLIFATIMQGHEAEIKYWWQSRRKKYNVGLIIAGITAFLLYAILGSYLITPDRNNDKGFEITIFTTGFQGVFYLIMMGIANLFYGLGAFVDIHYNKTNNPNFRRKLFNAGFWFSCGLPFLIPLLILIIYLPNRR